MTVKHDSRDKEYREPFGAVRTETEVSIAIRVEDPAPDRVRLMLWKDEETSPACFDMEEESAGTPVFRTVIKAPQEGCLLWYAFEMSFMTNLEGDGGTIVYYGNNSALLGGEGKLYDAEPERYQISVYKPSEMPEWYTDGIVYQIFPDRFARDEGWLERVEAANKKVNDRRSDMKRVVQKDWTQPAYYVRDETSRVVEWPMYGGSLKGIEEKLDYLKSLGITCIYLNPVFEASSNHRYDTGDYMHIDPALGTDEDFESLAKAAKRRGIRIILDGVFSHTGADSIYFDKYGNYSAEKGAWNNEDSPFRSWFKFDENEEYGYKTWWGVEDLPEVEENDPAYREFMLGDGGVIEHWLEKGASGWRLDVADELPDSFIAGVRGKIKQTDPDALLLGEVWEDASNKISYGERRRYFMGDELDATMHYPLRDILLDYVNYTTGAAEAADRIMSLAENYPPHNFYGTLNLIGSHDRERIMTMMAAEQDYEAATRKVRLLSTLQFCLPGVPCIYYGDEAGLMGGTDPENRSGYPWGFENLDLGYHYRMLGLIYDEHPSLKDGAYGFLSGRYGIGDDIFAFTRTGKDAGGAEETVLVLANRSYGESEADLSGIEELKGAYALELLTSTELPIDEEFGLGTIRMDRLSAMVITIRKERPETEDLGRSAGVICHVGSLPGQKLGKGARDFVDYIASAGFSIWQVLPLNPAGTGNSPYSSYAALAGDPSFVDYDELPPSDGYYDFINSNDYWLNDYIAYMLLKEAHDGEPWYEWPQEERQADTADILRSLTAEQKARAARLVGEQYCFWSQWNDLKAYANSKGVRIMGDLPMYMAEDSADVWANQRIFRLEGDGALSVHAGVPPDAFSKGGQDWGNPLYDWDALRADGYSWWLGRIRQCAERYDILRVDHFRGLSEYYAIQKGGDTENGCWQHSAGLRFISAIRDMLKSEGLELKLLAEDLGFLDAGVKNLLKLSGMPGMDIWQFTAGEMLDMCRLEPEKAANRAFYTGTHDNNTLTGWLRELAMEKSPDHAAWDESPEMNGPQNDGPGLNVEALSIIRRIYESPACLAMMQLQDVFLFGEEARMNIPGVAEGNWKWKVPGDTIDEAFPGAEERAKWLKDLAARTGRV